ncbi:hypothetical protein IOD16_28170 [Saccharothrix sp. 6-C]|uniref:hypothetical protein n=1 Tax=Saccharothrix sp. 6-C TaxID=2781735 RepID=UPI001916DEBB|nr:hypothetical protein [Saccharothrix sp. 6-C]QQQ74971.1 hypothetical protein IOD16_28170 [Saccharothrix sp. 6-C]
MSGETDDVPTGYPGFRVDPAGPLVPSPAASRRVAKAKLSSVTFFSARLGGEDFVFLPWLTTLIDHGSAMRFVGVYRTEPLGGAGDREPTPGDARWLCVRRSTWDRDTDWASVDEVGFGEHLASGAQVADTFTFATTHTRPHLADATTRAAAGFARGFTISAAEPRQHPWHEVSVDIADEGFLASFTYGPFLTRCEVAESVLPPWLEIVGAAADEPGATPDGKIRLGIRRSAPELVNAPIRAPRTGR